jgi:hypothetical protein
VTGRIHLGRVFGNPGQEKLSPKLIPRIRQTGLPIERRSCQSDPGRPCSCEYLALPALFAPDRFSLLGATLGPNVVILAQNPVPIPRWYGREFGERFEYRAISVKIANAAFDLPSLALDAFRLAVHEDE